MERLLTLDEAAEELNLTPRYMRRLVSERRIAFVRMGRKIRISESDLAAFVEAARVEPFGRKDVWRVAG